MKKWLCPALCALMLLMCISCTPEEASEKKAYKFKSGSTEIAVGANVGPILEKLGAYSDYYESPSCYFTGMDKIYIYGGFELHTYPDGGKDYIYLIRLYDDTVATAEGVRIGSSKSDVTKAYGDADTATNTSLIYKCDGIYMEFFLEGGSVVEIQYQHTKVREN